jgi:hypothetical protein
MSWRDQSAAHPALLTAREAIRGLFALEKRAKSVVHWFSFELRVKRRVIATELHGSLLASSDLIEAHWNCYPGLALQIGTPQGFVNRYRFPVDTIRKSISLRSRKE